MNRAKSAKGFTLIEMLVTVALIAVAMSGVVVFFSTNNPDQQLKRQIEQFIAFADHAADFAMVKGETWGIVATPPKWQGDSLDTGWKFTFKRLVIEYDEDFRIANKTWTAVESVPAISLPAEVDVVVSIEDEQWKWKDEPKHDAPIILLYSTGEKTLFEIEMVLDLGFAQPQHIEVDEWGNIVWRQRAEMLKQIEEDLEG